MSSQFQPYLESIRATYEKWWQLYTLTDAARRQRQAQQVSPTFDFGLMVQTVKKEERREEEKIERFPVLEGIRKYAEQHVLLVGRPGSGKSTALARLMLEEATTPQARLPVLVELRYWQGSIEQLIRDSLIRHDLPTELVEEALKQSLILFDGVNELPSEEARSQLSAFRRNHPKLPMVFTTRDLSLGGDLGIEKKLEMQPLTEAQMQAFIRAYLPEQAEQMLRQLKDRLREFGQTPLLLWMLCGLFQQTGTIPENLGLVFREFTQGYERYLKEDVRIESDRAWWKPVLQQLAWVMMQGEKPTEFRVAIRYEEAVGAIAQFLDGKVPYAEDFARKCLRDLQNHHLIQVGTNREELEFPHQLIQEYYAAEALRERLLQLNGERLKREHLNFLKWTEPVALMLPLMENETQALQVVELAMNVDYILGARLAGEVKQEWQRKTIEYLLQAEQGWLQILLLGKTRSKAALPRLIQLFNTVLTSNEDPWLCMLILDCIHDVGSGEASDFLLQIIESGTIDTSIKFSAARALRTSKRPEVGIQLLKILDNLTTELDLKTHFHPPDPRFFSWSEWWGKVSSVARAIIETLAEFDTPEVANYLLSLLFNSKPVFKYEAAKALTRMLTHVDINAIVSALRDQSGDISTKSAIVYSFGELQDDRIKQGLYEIIADETEVLTLRYEAAQVVPQSEDAVLLVPSLLSALGLSANETTTYSRFLEILIKISPEATAILIDQCFQKQSDLIYSAIGSFIHTQSSNSNLRTVLSNHTHELKEKLFDQQLESNIRANIALVIGQVEHTNALTTLIKSSQDQDFLVRMRSAEALGAIGETSAVPTLIELALDKVKDVSASAINALGRFRTPLVISFLTENHNYFLESSLTREVYISTLGKLLLPEFLPTLQTLLHTDTTGTVLQSINAIQADCKYYKYEIYQAHLEAQKADRQTPQNNDRPQIYVQGDYIAGDKIKGDQNNIDRVGNLNTGSVTIQGDQIGEQP